MTKEKFVRVWDLPVRVFHWSLVALFVVAYLSGENDLEFVHVYAGYGILGLLAFRLAWGFIGSPYARFKEFVHGPGRVIQYLRGLVSGKAEHYLGHNPAGGWMILALLISLLGTTWSGLEVYGAKGHGPLAQVEGVQLIAPAYADRGEHDEDDEHGHHGGKGDENPQEEFWEEIHEFFSTFTLVLIFLHILGVVVSSRVHNENLAHAMLTGRKQDPGATD